MIESLTTFWYLWLALAVLIVLSVFVWGKAMKASRRHREQIDKEIKAIDKERHLRETYSVLTPEIIENADPDELLEGISTFIQMRVEKSADINAEFSKFPAEFREMYALNFFCEDTTKSLSSFFRNNGEPLLSLAVPALKRIGANKSANLAREQFLMFDENNESVSYDVKRVEELDRKFSELDEAKTLRRTAADYIKNNKNNFIF